MAANRDGITYQHLPKECWINDPSAQVEVNINLGGRMETRGLFAMGDRVESDVLSTLTLTVDELLIRPTKG